MVLFAKAIPTRKQPGPQKRSGLFCSDSGVQLGGDLRQIVGRVILQRPVVHGLGHAGVDGQLGQHGDSQLAAEGIQRALVAEDGVAGAAGGAYSNGGKGAA